MRSVQHWIQKEPVSVAVRSDVRYLWVWINRTAKQTWELDSVAGHISMSTFICVECLNVSVALICTEASGKSASFFVCLATTCHRANSFRLPFVPIVPMSAQTSAILSEAIHGFLHFVQENAGTVSLRSHDYLLWFHCCNPTIKNLTAIYIYIYIYIYIHTHTHTHTHTQVVLYVVNFTIFGNSGTKGMQDIALFRILRRHT